MKNRPGVAALLRGGRSRDGGLEATSSAGSTDVSGVSRGNRGAMLRRGGVANHLHYVEIISGNRAH